jgi:hypothetical protein
VPPGPLADIKDLIYELYLAAAPVTLHEIAGMILDDQGLAGTRGTPARAVPPVRSPDPRRRC